MLRPLWLPQLITPHKPSRTSTWYRKQRYSSSNLTFPSRSPVLGLKPNLKRSIMATPSSFSQAGTLADDPVSQPRSIAQPSPTKFFEHEPLDHSQPSIRLLRISPILSAEGLIQCSMTHTTTDDAPYHCLSYTWGEPEPRQPVLIDGKYFYVQPNLFEFLKVIRADTARTAHQYWIDAVCIDQKNTAERNHQVMQMGQIYSKAEIVIAWLGRASKETVLHYQGKLQTTRKGLRRDAERRVNKARTAVYRNLVGNHYWTRAWITEELKLARRILVAIGLLTLTITELREMIHGMNYRPDTTEGFSQVLTLGSGENILGEPLAKLLMTFRNRKCSIARDRIFSLLALCAPRDHIMVDYGCSVFELVYSIMRSNEDTFCACSIFIVMKSLAPEIDDLWPGEDSRYGKGPYIEIDGKGADWRHLKKQNRCGVLSYVFSQAFTTMDVGLLPGADLGGLEHSTAPAKPPVNADSFIPRRKQALGSSFAPMGQGLGKIRISLWYLYQLRSRENMRDKLHCLCSRPWTGTRQFMTPIRVGYGDWDINAPESPLEG